MKHRVRIDMSFDKEADAKALMNFAEQFVEKAVNIKEDKLEGEISFCEREHCYHDEPENRPCEVQERVEAAKLEETDELLHDG